MRIIFMGNPDFAVPTLEQVAQSKHKILYAISNPPKEIGRGKKLKETAVSLYAKVISIPVLQPFNLNDLDFLRYIGSMRPDIFVVVAYKILPMRLLSIPRFGAINLHPSKLPRYRGAAPIQWSLINGDKTTAVTTIKLSREIDSGSILNQKNVKINNDDNFGTLSTRLSLIGANLVVKTLDEIEDNTIVGKEQDESKVTIAPKIKKEDLLIDWNKSAIEINNLIRAFTPAPGAYTYLNGKRLKIYSVSLHKDVEKNKNIGDIILSTKNNVSVQTGRGQLSLNVVQIEGKKQMKIDEFLRGVRITSKTVLGI
jgi:methionyl-tRNA formyltransferase